MFPISINRISNYISAVNRLCNEFNHFRHKHKNKFCQVPIFRIIDFRFCQHTVLSSQNRL
ncbi:hypothetical protein [Bacillus phage vB_BanS-Thrax3]|nr:hypothetical protein [Bacillus phage vB_BanS-Thrax3]